MLRNAGVTAYQKTLVECVCECGSKRIVMAGNIISGKSLSCGCAQREKLSAMSKSHGRSKTAEYKVWASMIQRCTKQNRKDYRRYGGRGISVCSRWLHSFENFIEDMGPRPSSGYSLERKNVSGNYDPSNCTWATYKQQARNTRRNLVITVHGEARCLAEWCEKLGLAYSKVHQRLVKLGWDAEHALELKGA